MHVLSCMRSHVKRLQTGYNNASSKGSRSNQAPVHGQIFLGLQALFSQARASASPSPSSRGIKAASTAVLWSLSHLI